jgi:hypothetical protein
MNTQSHLISTQSEPSHWQNHNLHPPSARQDYQATEAQVGTSEPSQTGGSSQTLWDLENPKP